MCNLTITCPIFSEDLTAEEALKCGLTNIKQARAAVYAVGDLSAAYQMCLHSRTANRVLLELYQFRADSLQDLYQKLYEFSWNEHFLPENSLMISFTGNFPAINNSHFGALKVKDAIMDYQRINFGNRSNIDIKNPDIHLHIHAEKQKITVNLDLSGQSLHKRGYLLQSSKAPIKENLAAALLMRANWPKLAAQKLALIDPMCGGATFLIEGALIAYQIAPNLKREKWGFSNWLGHIPKLWLDVLTTAQNTAQQNLTNQNWWIRGFEADPRLIKPALNNVSRAGLTGKIKIYQGEIASFKAQTDKQQTGLIICNPPYGVRLGNDDNLTYLYQQISSKLHTNYHNWQAAILCSNPDLARHLYPISHKHTFFNGSLKCQLLHLDLHSAMPKYQDQNPLNNQPHQINDVPLSNSAQMLANRLQKNLAKLKNWRITNHIECYRLYDADLPEYAIAVDIYGDYVHVQEYAAPKNIDPQKAQNRLNEALLACKKILQIQDDKLILKVRQKQKDGQQYQKQAHTNHFQQVTEGKVKILVNLTDYLDTGLFLDHRPLRLKIAQEAKNKRFLNLFCYTAVTTLHALSGGAKSTVSVDLSNTYLNWARKNLALNGYSETQRLIRADVMQFLAQDTNQYDLIYIDPPTFANSKKRQLQFDIQQDHVRLLDLAMLKLAKNGVLYFSTNFQRFKLDESLTKRYQVQEISNICLDADFKRNPKIHRVWQINIKN